MFISFSTSTEIVTENDGYIGQEFDLPAEENEANGGEGQTLNAVSLFHFCVLI